MDVYVPTARVVCHMLCCCCCCCHSSVLLLPMLKGPNACSYYYKGGFVVESFVPASVSDYATYVLKQQVLEAKCQSRHAGPVGVANLPT